MTDETIEQCHVCGCDDFIQLAQDSNSQQLARHGIIKEIRTVMCKRCGWIFQPEIYNDNELQVIYKNVGGAKTLNVYEIERNKIRSKNVYDRIMECKLKNNGKMKLLDVGGGVGQVSYYFAKQEIEVHVLDINVNECLHPNMKKIHGNISNYESDEKYDVIILSHILEHVWYPREILNIIKKMLKAGGVIYVEVPFELYTPLIKRKIGDICHVSYFSMKTLHQVLMLSGLHVIKAKRSLEIYNLRDVPVLYALVTNSSTKHTKYEKDNNQYGWDRYLVILEMFNLRQIYIVIKSIFMRRLKNVF
jgi:SAM-dependent methyltransferase